MKSILRVAIVVAAVLAIIPAAQAQMQCFQCDPYTSSCSDECWYCQIDHIDNEYCEQYNVVYSTCGDFQGACLNCTPTWQETSRQNVGTYGESHWQFWDGYSCSHHSVDLVTETDTSQCNANSSYWTRQSCDDTEDGSKYWAGAYVDCCDGYSLPGVPNSFFTCNHYHSCY